MIESELAFDKDGEPFALPDAVTAFRVYQLSGGRGAPKLVYDRDDGRPLVIDVQAGVDDLRERVETSARYRLDAINDEGKAVPNVPPAYVQVTVTPRNAAPTEAPLPANLSATDHAIRELVRANVELVRTTTELAKAVATQQPELMRAAAELLRAADGAGLPRRDPIENDDGNYDDEHDAESEQAPAGPDWVSVAWEALAMIKLAVVTATAKRPGPTSPGAPSASAPAAPSTDGDRASHVAPVEPAQSAGANADVDPHAHLIAIQAQLTPAERAFVMGALGKLSTEERAKWADELTGKTVPEGVAAIRTEIKNRKENVS